jgi:hypothetical protein
MRRSRAAKTVCREGAKPLNATQAVLPMCCVHRLKRQSKADLERALNPVTHIRQDKGFQS